jgi:hypothetical protein
VVGEENPPFHPFNSRARICKCLWIPGIDSARLGIDSWALKCLQIQAQAYVQLCTMYIVRCKSKLTNTVTKVVFDFTYLKVARGDSLDFEILGGVPGQLQHLRRQILQNCRAEQENISYSGKNCCATYAAVIDKSIKHPPPTAKRS